jgi:hypothetical protein
MDSTQSAHRSEVDMAGQAGDAILFSTEAWHARSQNSSTKFTRRLFYNFFSRSSRKTTAWNGIVDKDGVDAARRVLPESYSHMFDIDPALTVRLSVTPFRGPISRWGSEVSSSQSFFRDIAYSASAYGRRVDNTSYPGFLLPYTTRLTESRPFSAAEYFGSIKPIPALKCCYSSTRKMLSEVLAARAPAKAMNAKV